MPEILKKVTKRVPKPRFVPRVLLDEDIEAAIRLCQKWGAAITIVQDGKVTVQGR